MINTMELKLHSLSFEEANDKLKELNREIEFVDEQLDDLLKIVDSSILKKANLSIVDQLDMFPGGYIRSSGDLLNHIHGFFTDPWYEYRNWLLKQRHLLLWLTSEDVILKQQKGIIRIMEALGFDTVFISANTQTYANVLFSHVAEYGSLRAVCGISDDNPLDFHLRFQLMLGDQCCCGTADEVIDFIKENNA